MHGGILDRQMSTAAADDDDDDEARGDAGMWTSAASAVESILGQLLLAGAGQLAFSAIKFIAVESGPGYIAIDSASVNRPYTILCDFYYLRRT